MPVDTIVVAPYKFRVTIPPNELEVVSARPASERPKSALDDGPIPRQELLMALFRAHEALSLVYSRFFQVHGVTLQQFNVLRILYVRDENGAGLSCQDIGRRLINRVPDVTRLLDRLERASLIERVRCASDRRVVRVRLSARGHDLVERTHPSVMGLHEDVTAHLDEREVAMLTELLVRYRNHGLVEELETFEDDASDSASTVRLGAEDEPRAR
jgi:DNA-binding MarR family transcriptional regulator